MGMMVAGRKVSETAEQVRYEFGLDRRFDRSLTIDKKTWDAIPEDGRFDSATGAVVSKIRKAWQEQGEFPQGVIFAS